MAKKNKPLEFDAIAGAEIRDQHGEVLIVAGADISDLEAGRGLINDDHSNSFTDTIGRITSAKKILKQEDCNTERQQYYWDKVKAPYIYVKAVLFNDEDHSNAKAAAAILRNIHRNDLPISLACSVEGGILQRGIQDSRELVRTKVSRLALTFTPANTNTCVEPINLSKSNSNWEKDKILLKSIQHLVKTDTFKSFRTISRHAQASYVYNNMQKLPFKTMLKDISIDQWSQYGAYKKLQKSIEEIHSILQPEPLIKINKKSTSQDRLKSIKQQMFGDKRTEKQKEKDKIKKIKTNFKAQESDPSKDPLKTGIKLATNIRKSDKDRLSQLIETINKTIKGDDLSKALTAGYGGASSPMSRTGGSVLQSESVDKSGPGFKYANCKECGKESLYYPNQTKCRDCGKSYSFEQLVKLLLN